MKRKTIIILVVILLIVAGGCYYFIFLNKAKVVSWKTKPITKGKISIIVKATGTIEPDTTLNVGTQVTGIIWKLFADWNTKVKKGQLLTVIDTSFLYAARLDAEATLTKDTAILDQATLNYVRNKKLLKEKVVAEADYETALAAYESAKADVSYAKANLFQALVNLKYAVIRAPIDGVVIARDVELGQTVVSSMNSSTLFVVENNPSKMQVQANVDEADIGQCKLGQIGSFTVDAYPDEVFKGTVSQIRIQPVMVQNVVNYIVIIEVPNPDFKLIPGLTANLSIKVAEHKNILKIPASALKFTPPIDYISKLKDISDSIKVMLKGASIQSQVDNVDNVVIGKRSKVGLIWILKGKDLIPIKVNLGLTDGNFTEVSGDIKEGDEVVLGQGATGATASTQAAKSPFMPQFPSGRR